MNAVDAALLDSVRPYAQAENIPNAVECVLLRWFLPSRLTVYRYLREYRKYAMRCRVLRTEMKEATARANGLSDASRSADLVLQHLDVRQLQ
jgi:hypothetical protein